MTVLSIRKQFVNTFSVFGSTTNESGALGRAARYREEQTQHAALHTAAGLHFGNTIELYIHVASN
jgi:hypothetical protein